MKGIQFNPNVKNKNSAQHSQVLQYLLNDYIWYTIGIKILTCFLSNSKIKLYQLNK